MLLAIDVGNTNMVIGVYGEGRGKKRDQPSLLHHWRMETKKERTADNSDKTNNECLDLTHSVALKNKQQQCVEYGE